MEYHLIPERIRQELLQPHSVQIGELQSGGLSGAMVWRSQSIHGVVALRCWPAEHPSPLRLSQIHAALSAARELGQVYIPTLFANRVGDTFTSDGSRLWELSQWMPGVADYQQTPSDARLKSALTALANLHKAWATSRPTSETAISPTATERIVKLQGWLSRLSNLSRHPMPATDETHRLQYLANQTIRQLAIRGPELLQLMTELRSQPVDLHFVLRDIWSDHVLFTNEQVTGIIDFGAARVDEPATDVARLLGSLVPFDTDRWQVGWDAYHEVNPLVDRQRVVALDRVATLLSALQWLEWLVIEPRNFRVQTKELLERWQRLVARLEPSVPRHI